MKTDHQYDGAWWGGLASPRTGIILSVLLVAGIAAAFVILGATAGWVAVVVVAVAWTLIVA